MKSRDVTQALGSSAETIYLTGVAAARAGGRGMTDQADCDPRSAPTEPDATAGFDYTGAGTALIAAGVPKFIFLACRDWPFFDSRAGLNRLEALRSAEFVHKAGIFWNRFDFGRGLEILCRLEDPEYIYRAGRFWRSFDYERGLDALIDIGEARYIYYAGQEWRACNLPRALAALVVSGSAEYIFYAGAHWKEFDFQVGMEALLATGNCEYLYKAGTLWDRFDFERAWRVLEYEVAAGAEWRGRALAHTRWRTALRQLWAKLMDPGFIYRPVGL